MTDHAPQLAWGHINVNVRDLVRSVAFYELLGFEVYRDGIPYLGLAADAAAALPDACATALGLPAGATGRACIMQLGPGYPKLDLTEFDASSFDGAEPRAPLGNADRGVVRLCLGTRDLAATHAHLSGQSVPFLSLPQTGAGGLADIALCTDPDGTLIELIQIHRDKWPSPQPGI